MAGRIGWGLAFGCTTMVCAGAALGPPARADAPRHRLECPREPPADWGLGKGAVLDQAAVLSEKSGHAIDDSARPTLVPDRGYARGGVWHNFWQMGDEPGWSHYVDCQYRGSPRILRLKADGLKRCEQTAAPYSVKRGVSDRAVQTMTCD
jgi:hypothetical protein